MKFLRLWLVGLCLICSLPASSADRPVFTLVYDAFGPFIWTGEGGASGLYVDVLREALEERLEIPLRFEKQPWRRAQRAVEQGTADAMVTLSTPARLAYAKPSAVPLAKATLGVFTRAGHPRLEAMKTIDAVPDLAGYRLLTYLGDGWAEQALRGYEVDFEARDFVHVFNKLLFDRGDIFVQTVESTHYQLKRLGLENKVIQVPGVVLETLAFRLMIGDKSPYQKLLPEIDGAFREMIADGTMDSINRRYLRK